MYDTLMEVTYSIAGTAIVYHLLPQMTENR
jgi:hypothetical protein